jgi:regulatory protein
MDDDAARGGPTDRRPRREISLLARALGYLARREHSRSELARKLAPHAAGVEQLNQLLDDLEAKKLLSEARFVEVLARSRGERFGAARVKQELRAHGVQADLVRSTVNDLQKSELERARSVWQRRFGVVAPYAAGRAKQMRFLAARGFSAEVVRRVVGGLPEDEQEE